MVQQFLSSRGEFEISHHPSDRDQQWPPLQCGWRYELDAGLEGPALGIRQLLQRPLSEQLPPLEVRLGTTRGTNALLERRGARTAFVTTRGFADILRIANQDRPHLFQLDIQKPEPIFEVSIEVDERLSADGKVLKPLDDMGVRAQFQKLYNSGIESLAICLMHAYLDGSHEESLERIAREIGFLEVSRSSLVSPSIKIVPRGDTTVVDAYLNPVLREYVQRVGKQLELSHHPYASLKLMTSAGGLVSGEQFTGKESILSGPAGGVIGFSQVARSLGYDRAIGFDMGGTSTDVCRFDDGYELEFETQKGGVRIATPMLSIETVAAGGGSICWFDGVQMHVGPQSAGANPGPACYGSGGPLTVTDLNVFLGRIPVDEFPFPLDLTAVQFRLRELCESISNSPLGTEYQPYELAEGFLQIANANMVRAIRRVSIERGYDPAEFAMVAFGGAGGLHVCELADALGIDTVLSHPFAGLLSAWGIGQADIRRHGEQSILQIMTPELLPLLDQTFGELTIRLKAEVVNEGVPEEQIQQAIDSLDMRYRGVEATININRPDDGDFVAAYEAMHEQLYGYRHSGRPVEVVSARVEVVGRASPLTSSEPMVEQLDTATAVAELEERFVTVQYRGTSLDAQLLKRSDLQHRTSQATRNSRSSHTDDITLDGPMVFCEPTSTLFVPPHFTACFRSTGQVVLTRRTEDVQDEQRAVTHQKSSVDPVSLEIFNSQLSSIAEQMGATLRRTSVSTNVKERLDFSCALFDEQGRLIVNAPHIPVHLGAMGETVEAILRDNPNMQPGDIFVTNDPYRGGSHLPDVTVVTPVHDVVSRELLFVTASRAHHAEIGGIVPGSMPPFSKNLAEEGVLIRNFPLVQNAEYREAALRQLLASGPYPSRDIESNLADISAQLAANNMGAKALMALIERESKPHVQCLMQSIREAATSKMRIALSQMTDGRYTRTDHLDDGSPISVAIEIMGDRATVDFSDTGPVLATNLNANRAIVKAAVLYTFRCMIDADIPLNSGVLEPIEIILPTCLLNPSADDNPQLCPAMVGGNVETSQRVVDVLLGALNLAAASQGSMNNLTFGDDTFGYYETICGGSGATATANGANAVQTHMTNTRLTDPEILEHRYPVLLEQFAIRQGSGGAGLHQGGDGVIRKLRFLKPMSVAMISQRRGEYHPFGLEGGEPGELGQNVLIPAEESTPSLLPGCFQLQAKTNDTLIIKTPGGGGFGSPR